MIITTHDDFSNEVLTRLAVEKLKELLTPEQFEIMWLKEVEGFTFDEVAAVIGPKYRGGEITGSAMRYHRDKIAEMLQEHRESF
jgi:DNA-directed RNA polymerase specialized sigma24 family protein